MTIGQARSFLPRLRRLIDGALLAVVVLVALVVVAQLAPTPGLRVIGITGNTMAPALPDGSAIAVRVVPFTELERGDAILIHSTGPGSIVRRIVEVRSLGTARSDVFFQVQADTSDLPEATLVRASRVLGRVEVAVPLLGHVITASSTQLGVWSLLSALGSLVTIRLLIDELAARGRPRATELRTDAPLRRARSAR
jgi:hypothetical protein